MRSVGYLFMGTGLTMTVRLRLAQILILLLFTFPAAAKQLITTDLLLGEGDLNGVRLSYRPFEKTAAKSTTFGLYDFSIEASATYLEFNGRGNNASNTLFALSPVFSKQVTTIARHPLKIEIGVGLAYVRETQYDRKNLGSHYQFEDRLGLVLDLNKTGTQALALRYFHYSNGGLQTPNPGLDFLNLAYFSYF